MRIFNRMMLMMIISIMRKTGQSSFVGDRVVSK